VHILVVVQEQLHQIPLQQEEPLFAQPEDDIPYMFPMIPHSEVILQDPMTDRCLDIKNYHYPVELRMMEAFQQVDSKSFNSHAFMITTVEVPCSKFQPITFRYSFSGKYIKAPFRHMRFLDWLHLMVDFVDCFRLTDHLAAWLHCSFESVDLIMAALR
jgi:hypothetical protein